jgi:endonuclease YncB( thermonuclease family)
MLPALLLLPLLQQEPSHPPALTVELTRVVDGDTLVVSLDGTETTLRLLSVDTEEKIMGRAASSPSKPETVFGEETMLWAKDLFASLGRPARVGLLFPEGRKLDAYGRRLAHVILPDGRDYNLLLVELGKSPYFTKYGFSATHHAAFVAAQERARAAGLGIWDPATNRARSAGAPSAIRPYDRLLPWWDARARALADFRAQKAREPERFFEADEPTELERAFALCAADPARRVTLLVTVERFYEEKDGSLTALLVPGDASTALRAELPPATRKALERELRASTHEFVQNYWRLEGKLTRAERGMVLRATSRSDWVRAEPPVPPAGPSERRPR